MIILPVDKINVSVAMNKLEYSKEMASLVRNDSYSKVKKNPTLKTEEIVTNPK